NVKSKIPTKEYVLNMDKKKVLELRESLNVHSDKALDIALFIDKTLDPKTYHENAFTRASFADRQLSTGKILKSIKE
ncbi:MAG: hypothetical protein WD512_20910, partial [Candidatus Paceibacterota bacterium]